MIVLSQVTFIERLYRKFVIGKGVKVDDDKPLLSTPEEWRPFFYRGQNMEYLKAAIEDFPSTLNTWYLMAMTRKKQELGKDRPQKRSRCK